MVWLLQTILSEVLSFPKNLLLFHFLLWQNFFLVTPSLQYVSKINSWNIFPKALSDIQKSQALYQAKTNTVRFYHYSLCSRGELSFTTFLYCIALVFCYTINFLLSCMVIVCVNWCWSIFTQVLLLQVQYQSDQFLDKNKDYVVPEHHDLLCASKCSFVASLFPPLSEAAKSSKFSSIGSRFKVSSIYFLAIYGKTNPSSSVPPES